VVALFVVTAVGCNNRGPSTHVMVYNQSLSAITVGGHAIEAHSSHGVYVSNGVTDTLDVSRGKVVARLVIASLVPDGDPNNYDAAINVHEDVPATLYCTEYSPYIEAEIIAP